MELLTRCGQEDAQDFGGQSASLQQAMVRFGFAPGQPLWMFADLCGTRRRLLLSGVLYAQRETKLPSWGGVGVGGLKLGHYGDELGDKTSGRA